MALRRRMDELQEQLPDIHAAVRPRRGRTQNKTVGVL